MKSPLVHVVYLFSVWLRLIFLTPRQQLISLLTSPYIDSYYVDSVWNEKHFSYMIEKKKHAWPGWSALYLIIHLNKYKKLRVV